MSFVKAIAVSAPIINPPGAPRWRSQHRERRGNFPSIFITMTPSIALPVGPRPRRAGFTLIELLTVIAIVGVLAAILIPVVGKVRSTARRTQGLSNLRQIMVASLAYAQENRGRWFEEVGNADVPDSFYVEILSKYAFKSSGKADQRPIIWQDPILNYTGGDMHFAALLIYFPKSNWIYSNNFAPYNNLNNVKNPSRAVLFADNWANKDVSEGYGGVMPWINNVGTTWDAFPSTAKGKQTPTDTNYGSGGGQIDLQRDPGQAKLGFIDGHVAIVKRQDLRHSLFDPRY